MAVLTVKREAPYLLYHNRVQYKLKNDEMVHRSVTLPFLFVDITSSDACQEFDTCLAR
jgi:hypothetical protein